MTRLLLPLLLVCCIACNKTSQNLPKEGMIEISKKELDNKIKGGWAGQVIGVTYGGPTEFYFKGSMIQSYHPIPWNDTLIKWWYLNAPSLYDDVYMDLSFVDIFERCGLNAPADSFAQSFAYAKYHLWHANQQARYNIMHGIKPPASGYWRNNPHADCIDFQIEADFAGLMCPGMPNVASDVCDKTGHIMNSGDGWYGGVYVAAMYSLAFISNDILFIVSEALKTIPAQSSFAKCISDVIAWHNQYPNDWQKAWFELQKKWSEDIGCPKGTFEPYNIDAKMNAAYVVIGLLYGDGDFAKTIDIATRCGQDSDCNPATAGGIIGAIIGYDKIPDVWMRPLKQVEDMTIQYSSLSLNQVYTTVNKHALAMIEKNGGRVVNDKVEILYKNPMSVIYEVNFEGIAPKEKINLSKLNNKHLEFNFDGKAFVVSGYISNAEGNVTDTANYSALYEIIIDGKIIDTLDLPANMITRNADIYSNYDLQQGKHNVVMNWLNPQDNWRANIKDVLVYSEKK